MDRDARRTIIKACNPAEPVPPSDPRHHDFDAPDKRLRGSPWRERLANVIDLASGPTTQLVTGLSGSGKTTELHQLCATLRERKLEVHLADVGAWLTDQRPIEPNDLLLAALLAMYPEGEPDDPKGRFAEYADQVVAFLKSEIKLETASLSGLKLKLTTSDTEFQRVAKKLAERKGLREDVHTLLRKAQERCEAPIVLVLDGAEKRATGEGDNTTRRETFHNRWFDSFSLHARELQLPVHTIYTVPPFMVRRSPELVAQFGTELEFLPMIRLFDRQRRLDPLGLREVSEAAYKRVKREHFADELVVPYLAAHSGGYFRDLLRMLTELVYLVGDDEQFTREHAEAALRKIRRTYLEGFVAEERELVAGVMSNQDLPRDETAQRRVDRMLLGYKVFRYHDDEPWYGVHPLLWQELNEEPITWESVGEAWKKS